MGSVPDVYIKGPEDGGVCVVCMASGWYPKPQVHWRDSRGENLPASSETLHVDAEGLFSTETSLVLRDSSVRNVTCSTFNPVLGQEKALAMVIPGESCPSLVQGLGSVWSSWKVLVCLSSASPPLALCLGPRALLPSGLSLEDSFSRDPDHDGTSSLGDNLSSQKGTFWKAEGAAETEASSA